MRFLKEYIILFFIIVFVIVIEFITNNISEKSISLIDKKIGVLEEKIEEKDAKDEAEELSNLWKEREDKLSYYMEHNELEKISTDITSLLSNIKCNEIDVAKEKIDQIKFGLERVKNKQKFELKNIF